MRASIRRFGLSFAAAGRQRLELAALDAEEELLRLVQAFASILVSACLATLALAALSAAIVLAMWESRIAVLLAIAFVFAAAAGTVAWQFVSAQRNRPRPFAATLDELGRDAELLRGTAP